MDDKHKRIKASVEFNYKRIESCEKTIEELREECDHPEIERVNYQWAPGHISPNTNLCSICGKVIHNQEDKYWNMYLQDEDQSINP